MQKLTNQDLLSFQFLSHVKWAPGGGRAAFAVSRANEEKNTYETDLWLFENGAVRPLTAGGDGRGFFWEDETHILFAADRDDSLKARREAGEKRTVYQRIAINGGEAQKAFEIPLAVERIKPLAGGKYAVVAGFSPNDPDFGALDEAGKKALAERVKTEKDYEVIEEIPFWHNGGSFASRCRSRLYVFDPASGKAEPVTDELTDIGAWHVEGGAIFFGAKRYDCKMELTDGIYCYDVETKTTRTLLADGGYAVDFLCPDGQRLIFLGIDFSGGVMDYRQNPSFFVLQQGVVSPLYDGDEEPGGTVSSDCRYGGGDSLMVRDAFLYYTVAYHTGTQLKRLSLQGEARVLVDEKASIDCFDVANGHILSVGMRGDALQELYLDGVKQTDFNGWVNRERSILTPIPVELERDGVVIEGFYLEPVGREPGKKYPAILDIHGGPKVAYGHAFFHEMQVWANAGYYVLYCNPRGGDGRGEEFAEIRGKYGTIDYDDLMAFTDCVLALCPDIDAGRLGVTGGSYGGFMTNWIIGHTDRFRAAVSQRSISNWISKFGTTDIGYYFNASQHLSTPWKDMDKMWWHSPLKYADRAVTPTLFIHSDEDYRCWMAEALQMFTALRYHGVEARICLFHGENHELSRSGKPTHRQRRLSEILAWFDGHLK